MRMSACGTASATWSRPLSVPMSPGAARKAASGACVRIRSSAASTEPTLRPFTATRAPARAGPSAMAAPMPWVEPVTTAVRPVRSICTVLLRSRSPAPGLRARALPAAHTKARSGTSAAPDRASSGLHQPTACFAAWFGSCRLRWTSLQYLT